MMFLYALIAPVFAGLASDELEAAQTCTAAGQNAYITGHFLQCCSGAKKCLTPASPRWVWLCESCDASCSHDRGWNSRACVGGPSPSPQPSPQPNPPPSEPTPTPPSPGGAGRVGSFIVLGDWGYDTREHCNPNSGCGMSPQCQQNIANKMKQWVAENPDVKFVINVGDNFYATGVSSPDAERWQQSWKGVYGDTITNLKWYSVYGNHDYEGSDACACTDPATDASACAQLNGFNGQYHSNLNGWYMPDLYYKDTSLLEEFGIEIVGLDTNSVAESACKYLGRCQSKGRGACWNNLNARYRSSMDLFAQRMKETQADNVIVFNHYPSTYFNRDGRESFLQGLRTGPANGGDLYFFGGHVHYVKEQGNDYSWPFSADVSPAKQWLVGGGGGWGCDGPQQGFAVGIINKDENGKISIEMSSELVDPASCCYHQRYLSEEEDSASDLSWKQFESALKAGAFNSTCGGAECSARTTLLKKLRKEERLTGATTTETPVAKEIADDEDRESLANFEPSQYFLDTIESIKQIKAARAAVAASHGVAVE